MAGGEDGLVQVFDTSSRALLRQFTSHKRPVHTVAFSPDKLHIYSGGDDATVRLWDIASGSQLARMDGHSDYVRAMAMAPSSHDILATGGYDHTCKIWDARTHKATMSMNHGAPVESIAFFPSESLVITAGGSHLCCWDLFSGGRLLHKLSAHQKTITSVLVRHVPIVSALQSNSNASSGGALRIMSSSLDGHIKVFDPETFQATHASRYPSPILSFDISPDTMSLAVGTADGTLAVRRRRPRRPPHPSHTQSQSHHHQQQQPLRRERYAPPLTASSFRYFIRGQSSKAAADDVVVAARRKVKLAEYDRLIRRFRYREALDAALSTRRPEIIAGVVDELTARGALNAAFGAGGGGGGRSADTLLPIVQHASTYISDPRHTQMLCALSHRLLDSYAMPADSSSAGGEGGGAGGGRVSATTSEAQLLEALKRLRERANAEIKVQDELVELKGMLDALLVTTIG